VAASLLRRRTSLLLCLIALSLPTAAGAYEVRKSRTGAPLRWAAGTIAVELALEEGPPLPATVEVVAAARLAFATYAHVLGGMTSEVGVVVRVRPGPAPSIDPRDGRNTVRWMTGAFSDDVDPDALAITLTSYEPDSGRIVDGDIILNADYPWWTGDVGCHEAYDIQAVLTHEVGHLFGLGHELDDRDAAMFPTAALCETKKRVLQASDLDALHYLYAVVGPAPAGCAVGGGRGAPLAASWLVLGGALLALRRRAGYGLALGLLILTTSLPAAATTVRRLPLQAAGKSAALVVRAEVRAVTAVRQQGLLYTDAELIVAECLKGPCGALLIVRQLGGELDGEATAVDGTAPFVVGEEVVVLLRARRDGAYAPLGMAQGVLRVERRAGEVTLVRDLRGMNLVEERQRVAGAVERLRWSELAEALGR
jgi:hypothetical protein